MYDYKQSFDIEREYVGSFKEFLWSDFSMKPKFSYNGKRLYMTLTGYSIEEKAKNKKMILQAMHDFIIYKFVL